jgi:hypothetical protein
MKRLSSLHGSLKVLTTILALASAAGCDRLKAKLSDGDDAPVAAAAPASRAAISLTLGAEQFELRPKGDGYEVASPQGKGTIKVESDRVKVKLATDAKVKQKDGGFKVYDASDAVVMKGKYHGAGWKLSREEGTEVAKFDDKGGQAGGAAVVVRREGERWVVTRAGATVASVTGLASGASAALLAVTELSPEQRLAMAVFAQEFRR